jgi:hypothetical protein
MRNETFRGEEGFYCNHAKRNLGRGNGDSMIIMKEYEKKDGLTEVNVGQQRDDAKVGIRVTQEVVNSSYSPTPPPQKKNRSLLTILNSLTLLSILCSRLYNL